MPGESRNSPCLIKKYSNRRLYDTHTSTHVTLADIRQMVIEEIPFQVVDAKSGEDLTHLWDVDWERDGLVTSGPTDEETDHGRVQWYCWAREYPGKPMPPDCADYFLRRLKKDLELRKSAAP